MKFSSGAILLATLSTASGFLQLTPRAGISTRRFVLSEPAADAVKAPAAAKVEVPAAAEVEAPAVAAVEAPAATEVEAPAAAKVEAPPAAKVEATPAAKVEAPPAAKVKAPPAAKVEPVKIEVAATEINAEPVVIGGLLPGRYDSIDYSITLPFLKKPSKLDGSHAGDYGFDPLGLSEEFDIYYMQECETRHARLAMLAVVGWPLSELVGPDFMLQDGRAPSVLNGVNPISAIAILGFLGFVGTLEFGTWNRRNLGTKFGDMHKDDMKNIWNFGVAGDYNFDPAGLYNRLGDDASGRKAMRQVEIAQGRYAMVGITYFALYEALTGSPIVENNPFFQPNIVLPIAGAAFFVGSLFYELSDLRESPIRIQKAKLGHDLDEWLERRSESSK